MSKEAKLIKKILKEYNVDGSIFIRKEVQAFSHTKGIEFEHSASVWIRGSIENIKAIDFYHLTKLIFATLDAKGLKK